MTLNTKKKHLDGLAYFTWCKVVKTTLGCSKWDGHMDKNVVKINNKKLANIGTQGLVRNHHEDTRSIGKIKR